MVNGQWSMVNGGLAIVKNSPLTTHHSPSDLVKINETESVFSEKVL